MNNKRSLWWYIERFCLFWTAGTIIYFIGTYFNIVPYYETTLKNVNELRPITNLFPGQKIQLDFEANKYIERNQIKDAIWRISQNSNESYTIEGLRPIVTIPPNKPGIYNLTLTLKFQNNEAMKGSTNIYLVDESDSPIVIKNNEMMKISDESVQRFMGAHAQGAGEVEVYSGHGEWTPTMVRSDDNKKTFLQLNKGDKISPINNSVVIRNPALKNNPKSYIYAPLINRVKTD